MWQRIGFKRPTHFQLLHMSKFRVVSRFRETCKKTKELRDFAKTSMQAVQQHSHESQGQE